MKQVQLPIQYENIKSDFLQQAFVEVMLGRANTKRKHPGISKIESVYYNNPWQDTSDLNQFPKSAYALASLREGKYFELTFSKASINNTLYKEYFESGIFKMKENYLVNLDFMATPVLLRRGQYQIKFSDTLLAVRFALGKYPLFKREEH